MTFQELGIIKPILQALDEMGYTTPTPIQEQSIPTLLKGKDLLGCAQTGTGKTASFAIPILQNIYRTPKRKGGARKIKALIVTPTRELAIQIDESFRAYGKHTGLRSTAIFGGVKQGAQVKALQRGVDILVATPGRLLDLKDQGYISFRDIEYSVLDEADHMLDMGFVHAIKKIVAAMPDERQSLFFSATMPPEIVKLSGSILGDPLRVTIKPEQATAEKVEQAVYFVSKTDKPKLLIHILNEDENNGAVLVFSKTKHGADKIVKILKREEISAAAIHGNKSQNNRQKALKNFKEGSITVLVATDIAARGIDVDELSLVINYDLPNIPETYVHRIGRTGRADASGVALSFCNIDEEPYLMDIQKLIKQEIPVRKEHPYPTDGTEEPTTKKGQQQRRASSTTGGGRNRGPKTDRRRPENGGGADPVKKKGKRPYWKR